MPKALERKLWREANKHRDWTKRHKERYVYGSMRKTGWRPKGEKS